ncbi:tetratricopeptide repeat protein [Nocardia asteroides]|uniref:tetratricopeptide repeat protein n=1 Tax=Nocardia asteroides TaxID=1824 RepID=UPI001E49306E|nr:tetratricopeptide repeat protein [Nocardia asteroides]UGT59135.1 tetratricopeptide repeat protein [Nocardia asteroides]
MQRERVFRVTGAAAGSGYLIAARLVLTSAHVVGDKAKVSMFRPGFGGRYTGTVVWRGSPGGRDDAALVLLDDPTWTPEPARPVVWGRLVTDRPRTDCQTWGLPDFAQREGAAAEGAQHTGWINPGSGTATNHHVVELTESPPTAASGSSPWQGISGAAVFCEGLLAGVVAADPEHREHAALKAVPAYVLLADPQFRAAVEKHAGAAGLRWEPVELAGLMDQQSPLRFSPVMGSPAGLLQARRAVVPFRPGREQLLDELHAWASEPGVGVRLLHGPGGQGKTRLAHYFGEQLAGARWSVLWLDPAHTDPGRLQGLGQVRTPLLVIVDYAESRPDQLPVLFDAVATAAAVPGRKVKVVLLARTSGDWWTDIAAGSAGAEEITELARATTLAALDATATGREATYRAAVAAFAAVLPALAQTGAHDWQDAAARVLDSPPRDPGAGTTVLGVQMQALADLLDTDAHLDSTHAGRTLEDRVLIHERRYWRHTMAGAGLAEVGVAVLEDTVAATAVLGPTTPADLDAVIATVPELSGQPLLGRKVRGWLTSLYPGQTDTAFGGLAPDRLAEYLVGRTILDPGRTIIDTLATTITDPDRAEYLLTVCTRAAAHPALAAAGEHLTRWCAQNPATLLPAAIAVATRVEKPEPLTTALDHTIPTTSTETLQNLHDLIPEQTQALAPTAATLLQTVVDRLRHTEDLDASNLAGNLNNLAIRLGALGRPEDALTASEDAVRLWQALADQRPDIYQPALAMSLNTLANRLGALGRPEDALTASEDATQLWQALADQRPDTHQPALAMSLNNLAGRLGELGRPEDALTASEEAVRIRQALADQRPNTHQPALAMSLNNLAVQLAELGRPEDALTAIEEAVRLYRALADQRPNTHQPDLAMSLNNLAVQLAELGRPEDALTAIEEAVRLYRALADQRPEVYQAALSQSRRVAAWLSGEESGDIW